MTKTDFLKLNMTNAHIYIYRTPGKSSPEKRTPTKEREREGEQ